MTRDDIILLSQLAGFNWPDVSRTTIEERLERFAALVAAAEREACAKYLDDCNEWDLAEVIRKRGEVKP